MTKSRSRLACVGCVCIVLQITSALIMRETRPEQHVPRGKRLHLVRPYVFLDESNDRRQQGQRRRVPFPSDSPNRSPDEADLPSEDGDGTSNVENQTKASQKFESAPSNARQRAGPSSRRSKETLEENHEKSLPSDREIKERGKRRTKTDATYSDSSVLGDERNDTTKPTKMARSGRSTLAENETIMEDGLQVKPIGVVRSIYRLCVGTPRQGLLAPMARGRIDLFTMGHSSPASSVEGLEAYSHIWVLFLFHLNTQSDKQSRRIKSKISPPALGGQRVGIFATRSPHRFNPIGMTLCKLDFIERVDKRHVRLHISGLDLVDGTPVLDIKPYVPVYDSVTPTNGINGEDRDEVSAPNWVEEGLSSKRSVAISETARSELESILRKDPSALEFYGPGNGEIGLNDTMAATLECIEQVLAIDIRSTYQTQKSRAGRSRAEFSRRLTTESSETDEDFTGNCTQQLDNLLVHFRIQEESKPEESTSARNGAQDTLLVTCIELLTN